VLVSNSAGSMSDTDKELLELFREKNIPYIIAWNKSDISCVICTKDNEVAVSSKDGSGIIELKEKIASLAGNNVNKSRIVGDLLNPGDFVVLVTPIDAAAPKGRLILPQQQTIRDILDSDAVSVVVKEYQLEQTLEKLERKPAMVITDSQAFKMVSKIVPEDVPLTSFSILMARYKGFLETAVMGASAIESLKNESRVLLSEGCTHPLLKKYTGALLDIKTSSGRDFPEDLSEYDLVIHCGGCMLNEREVDNRRKTAESQGIPFTNYGTAIAYMNGILKRSISIFPSISNKLKNKNGCV